MIKKLDASLENGTYTGRLLHHGAPIICYAVNLEMKITALPSVLLVMGIHVDILVYTSAVHLQGKSWCFLFVPMARTYEYKTYLH